MADELAETIGNRIKKLREHRGLSLRDCAKGLQISHGYLGDIERGRTVPSSPTLSSIADFFGVTTDYLLGRTDVPNPDSPPKTKITPAAMAAWRLDGYEELSPEVQRQLEEYIEYVFEKHGKKTTDDDKKKE